MADMRVRTAMRRAARHYFLPAEVRDEAALDAPLPIGYDATCSQPSTVATMLTLLDVGPGHTVLDVGCGSGWTTALLQELVAPGGAVRGVEIVPELVAQARANLEAAGYDGDAVEVAAPGTLGLPEHAPFDRILVSAEAASLPGELVDQLAEPGVMVIPVAGTLEVVHRERAGVHRRSVGAYRFVPLQ
ncbi:MAG TPA: protein-L-isoaspartate O-methyltransferase [Actinomycetaceae bacterium]|nr:protein-L-isoaspartate O-methyltransferase [Actinomycetaceae bacterium]